MLNSMFRGIFDSEAEQIISVSNFWICIVAALIIGIFFAVVYTYKNIYTNSFVVTLAILPAVVCVVIMMVNGNVGAGVAVAGAFGLVRFRSAPGTAKEIGTIFLAMGSGLIVGMGYIGYAMLFSFILGMIMLVYQIIICKKIKKGTKSKTLRITIPEDLDYTNIFDDLFERYTTAYDVVSVKTTNMGSLFRLTFNIDLKDLSEEKEFIDQLRCRNGNLEISISRQETNVNEL